MSGQPQRSMLADVLALVLLECGPTSASELAPIVGARKERVLRELRTAPRFRRIGRGRASAWELAGTGREPHHGDGTAEGDLDVIAVVLDRLAALDARLAAVETRLEVGCPTLVEFGGQITVDEAAANGEAPAS